MISKTRLRLAELHATVAVGELGTGCHMLNMMQELFTELSAEPDKHVALEHSVVEKLLAARHNIAEALQALAVQP